MEPTYDDMSTLLRLILAEKFPSLTDVYVTPHRNWRNRLEEDKGFFLCHAWFGTDVIKIFTWFDLDALDTLIEDLDAKLKRRTKQLEDKANGKRRTLRRARILAYIKRSGGASFSEIQRFVVEEIHGLNWDQKNVNGRRRYRGYMCEYLTVLVLPEFCFKGDDGKWRIKPEASTVQRYRRKGWGLKAQRSPQ